MPKAKATPTPAPLEEQQPQPLQYDVNIYPSRGDGAQKASATVNINGQFAIRGLKIMEGTKGLFVSYASTTASSRAHKAGNGEYKDICFPCTKESRADFDKVVLAAYEQKMEQTQANAPKQEPPQQEQEQSQPVMAGM